MKVVWLALILAVSASAESGREAAEVKKAGAAAAGQREVSKETEFEAAVRESRNRVRRIRRRLRRAMEEGDSVKAEELRKRLEKAKARHSTARDGLEEAVKRGDVSPHYREIKRSIRGDLREARRARYALKKAVRQSDNRAATQARERLHDAKQRLKEKRRRLRAFMKAGGVRRHGEAGRDRGSR